MKKTLIILFALLSALQVSWGQGRIEVRGKVTASDNGEPLPGVAVSIGNNYTETDYNGAYSILVEPGSTLKFELSGMKAVSLTVKSSATMTLLWYRRQSTLKSRLL